MSVVNKQPANQTTFNTAFVSRSAEQTVAGGKAFSNYIATTESGVASAATITALSSSTSKVRLTGTTATQLQGIALGQSGQVLLFYNATNQSVTVKHQNVGATAANRIITITAADLIITAGSTVLFSYDSTQSRWVQSSLSSAGTSNFVGDSGSGGVAGLVPAPAAGDAAANKFLKADGTWATSTAPAKYVISYQNATGIAYAAGDRVQYNTSLYDNTGGAVTTGASWKFQPNRSGHYLVNVANFSSTGSQELSVFRNGTLFKVVVSWNQSAANVIRASSSCIVFLNGTTDSIDVRSSGSLSNWTSNSVGSSIAAANYIDINEI
jgi:hypothetical protein